jgi:hypothetical protein
MDTAGRLHLLRLAIALLGTAGIVLGGVGFGPLGLPTTAPLYIQVLSESSWTFGFGGVALLIGWRAPDRSVLLAGLFLAVSSLQSALEGILDPGTRARMLPFLIALGALGFGVGVRFTQAFPVPLTRTQVVGLGRGKLTKAALAVPAALLDGRLFWTFVVLLEVTQHVLLRRQPGVWHVLVYACLAAFYLWAGYRAGTKEQRKKTFWLMEGVLVFVTALLLWAALWVVTSVMELPFDVRAFGAWLGIVEGWAALVCFCIAIFFHDAFDSGLVLRRTAILSLTSGVGIVLFVALEETLGQGVATLLGLNSGAGAIIAGVVTALALRPVSERVERALRGRHATESAP